jgi:hypothetical protein
LAKIWEVSLKGDAELRLNLFDLFDREGWRLPVVIRIDDDNGEPDVVVITDDDAPVPYLPVAM